MFPKATDHLTITVDLIVDLVTVNPFDFFLDPSAERVPFAYADGLARELRPFLETDDHDEAFAAWMKQVRQTLPKDGVPTVDFLVQLNQMVRQRVDYLVRLEPGIQTPDQTLTIGSGSCRDSAWLLVQTLRQLGMAARFASGYLIQLTADELTLDGQIDGPANDFTDLHKMVLLK